MLAQIPERQMHRVRWVLTVGWLLVIASLFYDPWTVTLTRPDHPWSPLRVTGECVAVQGTCVAEQPYPIGATLFWGAIVPSGILILLIFGHELWRRICPLSFLSQIPRALGWQRQFKHENPKTGKVRYELAKVKADSWLGRNYPYVQFGWLFVGLCGRILFFNADRLVLAGWLVFTILAAIAVGYFYGGKSWCQYFCPMAPVQTIFSEPRGLLGSKAHMSDSRITQSMCRVSEGGNEQSACVACQSPCIDIDSERTYWEHLNKPSESLIRYGYVGLVVGYFVYYYLYAGNWDYYFSGAWNRDPNQLASLMSPGLYVGGQAVPIPKLVAVPLVLGGFTAIAYGAGTVLETYLKSYYRQHRPNLSSDVIRHRIFAICTFLIFNFFFFFAGRPLLHLMPLWVQYGFDFIILFLSTLWLNKTWRRNPALYSRENLASRFRKQLDKLHPEMTRFLDNRTLEELDANEVYVLAKVLPSFTQEKRHETYKGVLREALADGYINSSNSLEVLQQMRQELGISDDEHRDVLEELGIEDPDLLNPTRQRSLENQIRLSGYQKSLERLLRLQQQVDLNPVDAAPDTLQVQHLRREYAITPQEEQWILGGLSPDLGSVQKAEGVLARLQEWVDCDRALAHPVLQTHTAAVKLLKESIHHKQDLIVRSLLTTLTTLHDTPRAVMLAQTLRQLLPQRLDAMVNYDSWRGQLSPEIMQALTQPIDGTTSPASDSHSAWIDTQESISHLENLLHHYNALVQATALYLLVQLEPKRGHMVAHQVLQQPTAPLLQKTANELLALPASPPLKALPTLEKLIYLHNNSFFHRLQTETLLALGDRAEMRTYGQGEVITEAGDTCRELLLMVEGEANVHYQNESGTSVKRLHPEQLLDELEVLTHSTLENTIVAASETTRILAVPVDAFDDLLHDPDFARRVLTLEMQQFQRLIHPIG